MGRLGLHRTAHYSNKYYQRMIIKEKFGYLGIIILITRVAKNTGHLSSKFFKLKSFHNKFDQPKQNQMPMSNS